MQIDLHGKALQLLEALANSIHDREIKSPNPFFFSGHEIEVAEKWLLEFMRESKKDCVCLDQEQ
jgi:hypothetical protein